MGSFDSENKNKLGQLFQGENTRISPFLCNECELKHDNFFGGEMLPPLMLLDQ